MFPPLLPKLGELRAELTAFVAAFRGRRRVLAQLSPLGDKWPASGAIAPAALESLPNPQDAGRQVDVIPSEAERLAEVNPAAVATETSPPRRWLFVAYASAKKARRVLRAHVGVGKGAPSPNHGVRPLP